jgi:hypothetical protein
MTDTASGGPSSGTSKADAYLGSLSSPPEPVGFPDLDRQKRRHENDLYRLVGRGALGFMAVQLIVADAAFYFYGFWNSWDIPDVAITGWLGATVIQVIGVVLVITKNLFPSPADS